VRRHIEVDKNPSILLKLLYLKYVQTSIFVKISAGFCEIYFNIIVGCINECLTYDVVGVSIFK